MLEATQRHPWHLKTWPRANFRARLIHHAAWTLGAFGLHFPHRLESLAVSPNSPYAQLRAEFDRLGIFLGTSGPNRKIVVYAARPDRSVFVKIPLGPESAALVAREADALEALASDPDLASLVPAATRIAGHLAVEDLETDGVIYATLDVHELSRIHDMLERRSAITRQLRALRAEWPDGLKGRQSTHDAETTAALEKACHQAKGFLDGLPQDLAVPCYMAHGDFTRWNVLRAADGTARIIDWEFFGLKPRWFDLVHYIVSHDILVERNSSDVMVRKLQEVARKIGAHPPEYGWWQHVGLYVAYQSLYYTELYDRQVSLHPQAAWQLKAWSQILSIIQNSS
ncbi:phosphotransferase [Seohaeicola saemankumensis]|uniref:Phosphotransferase n=1 Tax=Seohaeicola saemankumensis TaxID=481181 RepID=A0ABW3TF84_9RHOB